MKRALAGIAAALLAVWLPSHAARAGGPAGDWISAYGRDHALAGRIWVPADGRFLDFETLADRAAAADYVMLGEKHDNADHHRLQARVIEALAARGRRPTVAFEMLGPEQAPALRRHTDAHPRDAAGLGAAVEWEARGWPDWDIYRPIAEAALQAGLPIVAANAARERAKAVGRKGLESLSADRRARLALDAPLAEALQADLRRQLKESHCNMLPEKALGPMTAVQRLRDASMADSLIAAAEGRENVDGAVLITGGGHARLDRAVPWYLRARRPEATAFSVVFLEVWPEMPDPVAYLPEQPGERAPYDAVWFTARVDNEDPCEKFADQLENAGDRMRAGDDEEAGD